MVVGGFGWFWVVLGGFGWFWMVLGGFGWFHVLVTTSVQDILQTFLPDSRLQCL